MIGNGFTLCRYAWRRGALLRLIKGSLKTSFKCVVHSGTTTYRAPDVVQRFKPNADYFYLTGMTEPDCWITFDSDDNEKVLYVPSRSPIGTRFDGGLESPEAAKKLGFECRPSSALLKSLTGHNLVLASGRIDNQSGFTDLSPYVRSLRLVKDDHERQCIKKSCAIICDAMTEIMKQEHPNERNVDAGLEYAIRLAGAEIAFIPVVAGGDNAAKALHYQRNNMDLLPGQPVLVDAGCEYENYCSDISRTFPNGLRECNAHFSVLHDIVLDVQLYLLDRLRQGRCSMYELYLEMLKSLGERLYSEGILNTVPNNGLMCELCPHDVGHHLGINVHDSDGTDKVTDLVPGNVVTVEPGLYIPVRCDFVKPEFRGYAIRIEDDILITENGIENLTKACPKSLSEMKQICLS